MAAACHFLLGRFYCLVLFSYLFFGKWIVQKKERVEFFVRSFLKLLYNVMPFLDLIWMSESL